MTKQKHAGTGQSGKSERKTAQKQTGRQKAGKRATIRSATTRRAGRGKVTKTAVPVARAGAPTKLDTLVVLMTAKAGATIAELCDATGWQAHSVRGAIAGALKLRGYDITSEKLDGVRRYRVTGKA